jgi:chemotaxis protein CheZ
MSETLPVEGRSGDDASDPVSSDRILARIGQLTRTLRDSMRELGLDKQVAQAANAMPDTHDRLRYVAAMTEQAAVRVLTATELAQPIQARLQSDAEALDTRWAAWYDAPLERAAARALMHDTRAFLQGVPAATGTTSAQLLEIMMAQDFQDLTGQVIKKITEIVSLIEQQLLGVLLENIAPERRGQFAANAAAWVAEHDAHETLMNGPQVNPEGQADVVQDQSQVDDLLASLGF